MNTLERDIVKLLIDLRKNHGAVGIKTEFECEGIHLDEFSRLKELTMLAELPITLKIGGCEAITGINYGKTIGVSHIVAPMIESAFAVTKFVSAINKCYSKDELEELTSEINVETITGHDNFEKILELEEYKQLGGVVIGRVDMTHSMGLSDKDIDSDELFSVCRDIFCASKKKYPDKSCTMGGVKNFKVLSFIKKFPVNTIDKIEQRKVIFALAGLTDKQLREGILKGLQYEIMWYTNKKNYYNKIADEDSGYLASIEEVYKNL